MNKKIFIFIPLFLTTIGVFAQNDKFQIGLKNTFTSSYLKGNCTFYNEFLDGNSIGLNLVYQPARSTFLEIGFNIHQIKQVNFIDHQPNPIFGWCGTMDPWTTHNNSDATHSKTIEKYSFLSVPVILNMKFKAKPKRKIRMYLALGLLHDFYLTQQGKTKTFFENGSKEIEKFTVNKNFERFNLSGFTGIKIEHQINKSLIARIEPYFQYGFTSFTDSETPCQLNSFGVGYSLHYIIPRLK